MDVHLIPARCISIDINQVIEFSIGEIKDSYQAKEKEMVEECLSCSNIEKTYLNLDEDTLLKNFEMSTGSILKHPPTDNTSMPLKHMML